MPQRLHASRRQLALQYSRHDGLDAHNRPLESIGSGQIRINKELGLLKGKAAAWFQPHCGIPGQLEIGWYLNRAGVLTV
jgi:hypothetical protein